MLREIRCRYVGTCGPTPPRLLRHSRPPRALLMDEPVCAFISKVVANTATYPLETVRLISLCDERKGRYPHLFTGYITYLPYCMASSLITYKILYATMAAIKTPTYELSLLVGAIVTAVATSFYKIPYTYYLKNRIIGEHINYIGLYKKEVYTKAFLATVSEDGPELFIKFFFNHVLSTSAAMHLPWPILGPLGAALFTSIAMCPIEFWKTSTLCHTRKMHLTPTSIAIRIAMTMVNMFIFFVLFGALRGG